MCTYQKLFLVIFPNCISQAKPLLRLQLKTDWLTSTCNFVYITSFLFCAFVNTSGFLEGRVGLTNRAQLIY